MLTMLAYGINRLFSLTIDHISSITSLNTFLSGQPRKNMCFFKKNVKGVN